MTGLFCRISSVLQGSFAKETCNFKEPTNRSHPIYIRRLDLASIRASMYAYIINTHAHAHTHKHTYTHTHTRAHTHTHTHTITNTHMIHIHAHARAIRWKERVDLTCACMYTHMPILSYTYPHIYLHTHTHTHQEEHVDFYCAPVRASTCTCVMNICLHTSTHKFNRYI